MAEPLIYESLGGAAASPRANGSSSKRGLRFSLSKQWSSGVESSDMTEELLGSSSSYTDLHSLAHPSVDEPRAKKNELSTISVRLCTNIVYILVYACVACC